ncbi:CheY-like chemotaxis protein [Algoriphagus iocasae]|uniref:CheY-like chemotaxis protein n=1 Tax=Algoriphagus iocasae TaxID=1836499 RepID=A0A841MYA9_9BACT|nr:response regulator [Algoriphagus iocasae]MBB6327445.1 CheY-like chemotaxis protein [Algoriphagus iocasae]
MTAPNEFRIVSIDDDKIQHILLKKRVLLIDSSAQVFPFEEPTSAMDFLGSNKTDLIFLDLNFPGISGWDLLQKLKEITDAPVVVLTGNISREEQEKISEFPQAIRLLEKPISNDHLSEIFEFLKS